MTGSFCFSLGFWGFPRASPDRRIQDIATIFKYSEVDLVEDFEFAPQHRVIAELWGTPGGKPAF